LKTKHITAAQSVLWLPNHCDMGKHTLSGSLVEGQVK
jgi:hypothetical protein